MKTSITTFALLALITSSAFAALKAPLPEFKNERQLAEWRAEKASQPNTRTATQESAFYTGRPYLASSSSYAFKYRSYSPDVARWTSEDPSGFPDGANLYCYINNHSTYAFDFLGLAKKVLWLVGLPGNSGPTGDSWSSAEISGAHSTFKAELVGLDSSGNPEPHYLDDGDSFDFNSFSNPNDIASFSDYDQIYIACHGDTDPSGVLNGNWIVGGVSYGTFAFTLYNNVTMVNGCNPTDGFIDTATLVSAFKDSTKNYLYE